MTDMDKISPKLQRKIVEAHEYAERYKEHKPVKGGLYRSRLGHEGTSESDKLRKGDVIMVVSEPFVVDHDVEGKPILFPEWEELCIVHGEKMWNISGMAEDSWYHWFEKVEL